VVIEEDVWSAQPPQSGVKEPATLKRSPEDVVDGKHRPGAVDIPDPGLSYNPAVEQWEALVAKEEEVSVKKEVERLEEEREQKRVKELFRRGEGVQHDDDDDDSEPTRPDFVSLETTDTAEKKKKKKKKENKVKKSEHGRVRPLVNEHVLDSKEEVVKKEQRKEEKKKKKLLKSLHGIEEPRIEVQLADELADSLRTLKPEGNLLRDRYRSAQERGLVEPRKPTAISGSRKAKKVKAVEKHSHRDVLMDY